MYSVCDLSHTVQVCDLGSDVEVLDDVGFMFYRPLSYGRCRLLGPTKITAIVGSVVQARPYVNANKFAEVAGALRAAGVGQ